jgi:hypothetical protein
MFNLSVYTGSDSNLEFQRTTFDDDSLIHLYVDNGDGNPIFLRYDHDTSSLTTTNTTYQIAVFQIKSVNTLTDTLFSHILYLKNTNNRLALYSNSSSISLGNATNFSLFPPIEFMWSVEKHLDNTVSIFKASSPTQSAASNSIYDLHFKDNPNVIELFEDTNDAYFNYKLDNAFIYDGNTSYISIYNDNSSNVSSTFDLYLSTESNLDSLEKFHSDTFLAHIYSVDVYTPEDGSNVVGTINNTPIISTDSESWQHIAENGFSFRLERNNHETYTIVEVSLFDREAYSNLSQLTVDDEGLTKTTNILNTNQEFYLYIVIRGATEPYPSGVFEDINVFSIYTTQYFGFNELLPVVTDNTPKYLQIVENTFKNCLNIASDLTPYFESQDAITLRIEKYDELSSYIYLNPTNYALAHDPTSSNFIFKDTDSTSNVNQFLWNVTKYENTYDSNNSFNIIIESPLILPNSLTPIHGKSGTYDPVDRLDSSVDNLGAIYAYYYTPDNDNLLETDNYFIIEDDFSKNFTVKNETLGGTTSEYTTFQIYIGPLNESASNSPTIDDLTKLYSVDIYQEISDEITSIAIFNESTSNEVIIEETSIFQNGFFFKFNVEDVAGSFEGTLTLYPDENRTTPIPDTEYKVSLPFANYDKVVLYINIPQTTSAPFDPQSFVSIDDSNFLVPSHECISFEMFEVNPNIYNKFIDGTLLEIQNNQNTLLYSGCNLEFSPSNDHVFKIIDNDTTNSYLYIADTYSSSNPLVLSHTPDIVDYAASDNAMLWNLHRINDAYMFISYGNPINKYLAVSHDGLEITLSDDLTLIEYTQYSDSNFEAFVPGEDYTISNEYIFYDEYTQCNIYTFCNEVSFSNDGIGESNAFSNMLEEEYIYDEYTFCNIETLCNEVAFSNDSTSSNAFSNEVTETLVYDEYSYCNIETLCNEISFSNTGTESNDFATESNEMLIYDEYSYCNIETLCNEISFSNDSTSSNAFSNEVTETLVYDEYSYCNLETLCNEVSFSNTGIEETASNITQEEEEFVYDEYTYCNVETLCNEVDFENTDSSSNAFTSLSNEEYIYDEYSYCNVVSFSNEVDFSHDSTSSNAFSNEFAEELIYDEYTYCNVETLCNEVDFENTDSSSNAFTSLSNEEYIYDEYSYCNVASFSNEVDFSHDSTSSNAFSNEFAEEYIYDEYTYCNVTTFSNEVGFSNDGTEESNSNIVEIEKEFIYDEYTYCNIETLCNEVDFTKDSSHSNAFTSLSNEEYVYDEYSYCNIETLCNEIDFVNDGTTSNVSESNEEYVYDEYTYCNIETLCNEVTFSNDGTTSNVSESNEEYVYDEYSYCNIETLCNEVTFSNDGTTFNVSESNEEYIYDEYTYCNVVTFSNEVGFSNDGTSELQNIGISIATNEPIYNEIEEEYIYDEYTYCNIETLCNEVDFENDQSSSNQFSNEIVEDYVYDEYSYCNVVTLSNEVGFSNDGTSEMEMTGISIATNEEYIYDEYTYCNVETLCNEVDFTNDSSGSNAFTSFSNEEFVYDEYSYCNVVSFSNEVGFSNIESYSNAFSNEVDEQIIYDEYSYCNVVTLCNEVGFSNDGTEESNSNVVEREKEFIYDEYTYCNIETLCNEITFSNDGTTSNANEVTQEYVYDEYSYCNLETLCNEVIFSNDGTYCNLETIELTEDYMYDEYTYCNIETLCNEVFFVNNSSTSNNISSYLHEQYIYDEYAFSMDNQIIIKGGSFYWNITNDVADVSTITNEKALVLTDTPAPLIYMSDSNVDYTYIYSLQNSAMKYVESEININTKMSGHFFAFDNMVQYKPIPSTSQSRTSTFVFHEFDDQPADLQWKNFEWYPNEETGDISATFVMAHTCKTSTRSFTSTSRNAGGEECTCYEPTEAYKVLHINYDGFTLDGNDDVRINHLPISTYSDDNYEFTIRNERGSDSHYIEIGFEVYAYAASIESDSNTPNPITNIKLFDVDINNTSSSYIQSHTFPIGVQLDSIINNSVISSGDYGYIFKLETRGTNVHLRLYTTEERDTPITTVADLYATSEITDPTSRPQTILERTESIPEYWTGLNIVIQPKLKTDDDAFKIYTLEELYLSLNDRSISNTFIGLLPEPYSWEATPYIRSEWENDDNQVSDSNADSNVDYTGDDDVIVFGGNPLNSTKNTNFYVNLQIDELVPEVISINNTSKYTFAELPFLNKTGIQEYSSRHGSMGVKEFHQPLNKLGKMTIRFTGHDGKLMQNFGEHLLKFEVKYYNNLS